MESNGVIPQFRPLYSVKVPNAAKNGEVVEFFVETLKDGDERALVVIRVHDDFVWLLHCLKTQDNVTGIIFPPLPSAPSTSVQAAEKRTKKQMGVNSNVLVGDDYGENFRAYEKFLTLCITHPRLGHSNVLQRFLLEKEAPAKVKIRQGILGTLTKAVDDIRTMNFKDSDNDFHNARINNNENVKHMKEAASAYQKYIDCEHRLSSAYSEIQKALTQIVSDQGNKMKMEELCEVMWRAAEHASEMSHVNATNRQRTMGATLKLYAGYTQSQQEMLNKRVFKLMELEKAKKNYEKAKPQKKQQVNFLILY
ncbi:unnamed protein product [Clavelina lepadiformis]|uniref:PX domain-containing protein n=1 Tax=Clavelina lepadiformis TaxID=159417 RepID=A0ABP0FZY7_CLALP